MTTSSERVAIDIFQYSNAAVFLAEAFLKMRERNPRYSLRALAASLKLKNPTTLFRIVRNQRRIPKKSIQDICAFFKFDGKERAYFELLAVGSERISPESFEAIRNALKDVGE